MKRLWDRLIVLNRRFCVLLWGIMLLFMVGIAACDQESDPDPESSAKDYQKINSWILDMMDNFYYWNTQIPRRTDKTLYPEDYFESLLSSEDRFSWIQENYVELMNSLSGVNTEAGYDFNLRFISQDSKNIIGYITYIKPGTPVEATNLKRGDYFLKINGVQMTGDNYQLLLSATSKSHTLGIVDRSTGVIIDVPLSVIEYAENPIFLDTIYHIQNKKIGYFVYNFFARDSESGGITYEKELNDLFGKYKNEGIDELIIDLRYNSGGTVVTAIALASMISNRPATDIFGYEEYNSILDAFYAKRYGKDYYKDYFLDNINRYNEDDEVVEQISINKLTGLKRIYLIVTRRTASASELVINGLRPYLGNDNVILIGETTRGKNVGSYTIYETDPEKQKTNSWGIQPIVLKLSNSNNFSDYANGFTPDVNVREEDEDSEMKPLGDIEELMLSAALNNILGITKSSVGRNIGVVKPEIIGSSIDRTPARQNMYFDLNTYPKP